MSYLHTQVDLTNLKDADTSEFKKDGGEALFKKEVHLPQIVIIPLANLGPCGEWDKNLMSISFEYANLMFTFVVDKKTLLKKIRDEVVTVQFSWYEIMKPEQSHTGETYRPIRARIT